MPLKCVRNFLLHFVCMMQGPRAKKYRLYIDYTDMAGVTIWPLYRALCQRPSIFAVAKDRHGTGLTKATPATPKC
jgi:hypothetical protein